MILLVLWVCFFSQTSRRKGNNVCHFVPFAFRSPLRSVARPVWCRSRRTSWITAARTSPSCSPLWGYVCISPWFVCRSWREFWFAYTLIKMRSFSSSDGLCANYKVCSKCIASWCTLMFHSVWQLNLFYTHACRYNFNPDCFSTCFSTNLRFSLVCISLCPHLCFFFFFFFLSTSYSICQTYRKHFPHIIILFTSKPFFPKTRLFFFFFSCIFFGSDFLIHVQSYYKIGFQPYLATERKRALFYFTFTPALSPCN